LTITENLNVDKLSKNAKKNKKSKSKAKLEYDSSNKDEVIIYEDDSPNKYGYGL